MPDIRINQGSIIQVTRSTKYIQIHSPLRGGGNFGSSKMEQRWKGGTITLTYRRGRRGVLVGRRKSLSAAPGVHTLQKAPTKPKRQAPGATTMWPKNSLNVTCFEAVAWTLRAGQKAKKGIEALQYGTPQVAGFSTLVSASFSKRARSWRSFASRSDTFSSSCRCCGWRKLQNLLLHLPVFTNSKQQRSERPQPIVTTISSGDLPKIFVIRSFGHSGPNSTRCTAPCLLPPVWSFFGRADPWSPSSWTSSVLTE